MTASTTRRRESAHAPSYRTYTVEVARTERLGPSFVRITLTGEDLHCFGAAGPDQRVKLLLPQPGRTVTDLPGGLDWHAAWKAMPNDIRPSMRTYTVRAHRPELGELDIDFVLHGIAGGHSGPASTWAATARPGDRVGLVGPDRPGAGRMWGCEWSPPASARSVLLAGDETAVPAMAAILESLPAHTNGVACVEVPTTGDLQSWKVPAGVDVRWLVREQDGDTAPHGQLLEMAVSESLNQLGAATHEAPAPTVETAEVDQPLLWDVPGSTHITAHPGELYGWLAGEAGVIKRIRRMMVEERSVPRSAVAFMGYWRQGAVLS